MKNFTILVALLLVTFSTSQHIDLTFAIAQEELFADNWTDPQPEPADDIIETDPADNETESPVNNKKDPEDPEESIDSPGEDPEIINDEESADTENDSTDYPENFDEDEAHAVNPEDS